MKRILFGILLAIGLAVVFSVETDAAQHEFFVKTTRNGSDNFPNAVFSYDYSIVVEDVDGYSPHLVMIEYIYTAGEGVNMKPSEYSAGKLVSSNVRCFYSKSDGTYRPFDDNFFSPSSDGYVSYKYYYSFQNGLDFNESESENMGAFLSLYYDSTSSMNIPVLHVPYSERDSIEQIVADYFINGGSSSYVANKDSLGSDTTDYPPLTDEYIIEDKSVGRVNMLKMTTGDAEFSEDGYDNLEAFLFTWSPRIGEYAPLALKPSIRLQVQADIATQKHFFSDREIVKVPLYDSFHELMIYGRLKGEITMLYIQQVLKRKEIKDYAGTEGFYFRILEYHEDDGLYHAGGWVRVYLDGAALYKGESNPVITESGYFASDGSWVPDMSDEDSYKFKSDVNGHITEDTYIDNIKDYIGSKDQESIENNKMDRWSWDNINSVADFFLDLPKLIGVVFNYIPSVVLYMFTGVLLCVVAMRILGR